MKLLFLGTSAAQPTKSRGLSCVCLELDGEIIMFDAGEAAQIAYMRSGLGWNKRMKIMVTHMHGDHCVGILGMLQTMSMRGRTAELEIFGPPGIEEFIGANIRVLNFTLSFPVLISRVAEGTVYECGRFSMRACRASHKITAYSYLFVERDRPGRFNVKQARALGVPEGELWGRLQKGESISLGERTIRPEHVLGEGRRGRRIGVSGDTMPTPELEGFFAGCDYLIFDSTFLDGERSKARETCHSTAAQAATLARNAGVRNLILTHFSARYRDADGHLLEAGRIHGAVTAARDLLEIDIE